MWKWCISSLNMTVSRDYWKMKSKTIYDSWHFTDLKSLTKKTWSDFFIGYFYCVHLLNLCENNGTYVVARGKKRKSQWLKSFIHSLYYSFCLSKQWWELFRNCRFIFSFWVSLIDCPKLGAFFQFPVHEWWYIFCVQ